MFWSTLKHNAARTLPKLQSPGFLSIAKSALLGAVSARWSKYLAYDHLGKAFYLQLQAQQQAKVAGASRSRQWCNELA
jgi:hypothetical protein